MNKLLHLKSLNEPEPKLIAGGQAKKRFYDLVSEPKVDRVVVAIFSVANLSYIQKRFNNLFSQFIFNLILKQFTDLILKIPKSFIFNLDQDTYGFCIPVENQEKAAIFNILNNYLKIMQTKFTYRNFLVKAKVKIGASVYNMDSSHFWTLIRYSTFALHTTNYSTTTNNVAMFNYLKYQKYCTSTYSLAFLKSHYTNNLDNPSTFYPLVSATDNQVKAFLIDSNFHKTDFFLENKLKKIDLWNIYQRQAVYNNLRLFTSSYGSEELLLLRYPRKIFCQKNFSLSQFIFALQTIYDLPKIVLIFTIKNLSELQALKNKLYILNQQKIKVGLELTHSFMSSFATSLDLLKQLHLHYVLVSKYDYIQIHSSFAAWPQITPIILNINSSSSLSNIINYPVWLTGKYFLSSPL